MQGRQEAMHQSLGTAFLLTPQPFCSHHSLAELPPCTQQKVLGVWVGEQCGGHAPLPIPGEEGGGAARQHLSSQQIQPREHHRNLGLGMAGANVSCIKYLQ